jgi:hypothetical protein
MIRLDANALVWVLVRDDEERLEHARTYDNDHHGLNWYSIERFKQFTPRQEEAVAAFLNYIIAYPSQRTWNADRATEALKSYLALPRNERPHGIEIAD